MPKIDQFTHSRSSILYSSKQRQIERIAMLKWQMNPSDYHFLCPQKWGNIGLTSAHNKIIERWRTNFICPIVRNVKGNALFIRLFLLLFRDIDLARVRPHFNPSLFCLPKMGETREHLLLYPFSDQKPNICCHRCSISNQLKNTGNIDTLS